MFYWINRKSESLDATAIEVYQTDIHPSKFKNFDEFVSDSHTHLVKKINKPIGCKFVLEAIEEAYTYTKTIDSMPKVVHSPVIFECAVH